MPTRPITAAQRDWLQGEVRAWRAEGLISEDQARRVLGLYESPAEATERQQTRGVFALMAVAGLFVGLAVLLLVGYNWAAMPAGLKFAAVLAAVLAAHAGGFYLRYARQARVASELTFFLGCLFYGAGIWLVAQIFHLNAHYPDGVWWWAVGVLPFALCLDTLLLHALLAALLAVWAGTEVLGFGHLGGWFFGRWGFLPNGAYTLPLLALPGLVWAYRRTNPAAVGLYAPVLAWWVVLQPFAWRLEVNPVYFVGAVGGLFLLLAESHRPGSPFAVPYRLWGVVLAGGALVPLSFHGFNQDQFRGDPQRGALAQTAAIAALAAVTVVATALYRRRSTGRTASLTDGVADLLRRQWLPSALVLLMAVLAAWEWAARSPDGAGTAPLVPTVLANLAMLGCGQWLIAVGLREDRGRPFAAGVGYFLLWAVLRYADLFGELGGMLGAAMMFFLCGAVLFGVALYWRQRKGTHHA